MPSPLYSTLLVALAGRRGASALIVEDELFAHTDIRAGMRDRVGSRAGEYIVNPTVAPWQYRVVLGLVYTVPWGLAVLYTCEVLVHYVVAGSMLYTAAAGYGLLFMAAVAAYVRAFRDTPDLPSPRAHRTGVQRRSAARASAAAVTESPVNGSP